MAFKAPSPTNNFLVKSPFTAGEALGSEAPAPPSDAFLLLDGDNFELLDGDEFTLLE